MDYQTNPERSIDMVERMFKRFETMNLVMPESQRRAYEAIAKNHNGNVILDIGCGCGVGTHILSSKAYFVWGIDVNPVTVRFADQLYGGVHGNIRFDEMSITNLPPRELSKFDVICAIDVLEHIEDYQKALDNMKFLMRPDRTVKDIPHRSVVYISTPNKNALTDATVHPHNPFHVREWTPGEFYEILTQNFGSVMLYTAGMEKDVDLDTKETPLTAVCFNPLKGKEVEK